MDREPPQRAQPESHRDEGAARRDGAANRRERSRKLIATKEPSGAAHFAPTRRA